MKQKKALETLKEKISKIKEFQAYEFLGLDPSDPDGSRY
jgi:hypothetical protein